MTKPRETLAQRIKTALTRIRTLNNEVHQRKIEIDIQALTVESLTERLASLSIDTPAGPPNTEPTREPAWGDDRKDARPGDRVIITNRQSNPAERHPIVTAVKNDAICTNKAHLRCQSAGRESWKALKNVLRVLPVDQA